MKSTKNLLLTGVALVIALFASIQITAMEAPLAYSIMNPENTDLDETQTINPHLSEQNKQHFWHKINEYANLRKDTSNPNNRRFIANLQYRTANDVMTQKMIDRYKSMYYGNKPYSHDEIVAVLRGE